MSWKDDLLTVVIDEGIRVRKNEFIVHSGNISIQEEADIVSNVFEEAISHLREADEHQKADV